MAKDRLFHTYEPAVLGIHDEAPGALPNGTRVEKINSEPGDAHPDGTQGRVVGSWGPLDDETKEQLKEKGLPPCDYFYFVEWDDIPDIPVGIADRRIAEVV